MNEAVFRKQQQLKQKQPHTNLFWFCLQLGIFAGLIWGGIRWIAYLLHFTKVVPGFMLVPFIKHEFLITIKGGLLGWGMFILLSILASFLYTLLLRKIPGPWAGMIYGLVWWGILFVGIGPQLKWMPSITKMNWDTIWTDSCVFVLWGLFIGYTAAVEYNDERLREPVLAESIGEEGKGSTSEPA